jgi:hypothetical protein
MPTPTKAHDEHSPLDILTEIAIEGTSSFVEAQRALLNLAQQENDIILNGVKERIGGFLPAVAMTDLVRRSLETLLGMQQELLTTTSKQALRWLESERAGKGERGARMVEFAREGVEMFTRAQKKFLDVVAQEAAKATSGKGKKEHDVKPAKRTALAELARDAGKVFIETQKRLLDVMGQQMNGNLDATTRTLELMSPSRLAPMANLTGEGVRSLVDAEASLIGSLIKPPKKAAGRAKQGRGRAVRQHKVVPA